MASEGEGAAASRQIQVLLTLHDGERSFGMSLAQKSPPLGPKYTVVSSVFANSPADRAGVRKVDQLTEVLQFVSNALAGYVVRFINDRPMNGLTVAQVANNFRNAAQAKITLEILENTPSPRTSAFTAAATFGGVKAAIPSASGAESGQRPVTPVTGFSAASSGRAIAAPGTALAVPRVASPKQPVLRLSAKPAAKTLAASQPQATPPTASSGSVGPTVMPKADAKIVNGAAHAGLKSKAVAPVLRLGPKPKPVPEEAAPKEVPAVTKVAEPKLAAKSVPNSAPEAKRNLESSRIPQSPVQATEAPRTAANKETRGPVATAQAKDSPAPVAAAPTAKATPIPAPPAPLAVPSTVPAVVKSAPTVATMGSNVLRSTPSSSTAVSTAASQNGATSVERAPVLAAAQSSVVSSSKPTAVRSSSSPAIVTSMVATVLPTSPTPAAATTTAPKPVVAPARSTTPTPAVTLPSQTPVPTRSPPVATAPRPQPDPARSTIPAPVVIPPNPPAVPPRSGPLPPPVVTAPRPQPQTARNTTPAAMRSPANAATPAQPASAVSTPTATKPKTGKKRGRPRKNTAATNGTTSHKGKGKAKAKKATRQQEDDEADELLEDEEVLDMYALSSDSDTGESPSKKTARRAGNGRRRGVTDRTRHSLTVDRLVGMGFTQEDAEASVREIGDDPDACMIWIISKIEERQFTRDLNEASIQSEQAKRDEEKRAKKLEMETLVHAEKFMSLFPSSYIACPESSASHLKRFLHSTIDQVDGETYIRKIVTKLLTLEAKSIRWYKHAVRSYMLELAGRLDVALGTHDVMTCCARISSMNADPSDVSCNFIRKILEEEKALTKALFEMPTNQGGVPPVFLECDETTKFDLDDDGFEVVEPDDT